MMYLRPLSRLGWWWRGRHNLRVRANAPFNIRAHMTREWPEEWDVTLRSISPRTSAYSYLYPKWEFVLGKVHGQWVDRSRWVLYQAQPAWALSDELHRMMQEPPPRCLPIGRAHARRTFVDDYAYDMYHTHRIFPRPFWILQGRQGGNPAGYSMEEEAACREMGEPTTPPPVGALPYAGFDWRVVEQILMRDRLLAANMQADAIVKPGAILRTFRADLARSERRARRHFIEWFKGTLAPGADFLTWYTRRTESDRLLRQATKAELRAARETEDTYIETGLVPVVMDRDIA